MNATAELASEIVTGVATVSMLGGQYKWGRTADGKYAMLDVEFFSEHEKGENGVEYAVTREWLKAAYAQMCADYPKTMIPVNIFHHDDEEIKADPIHIGYAQPTGLKEIFVNNKYRLTIMVNVVGLEEPNFRDVQLVRLPYRSAEIASFRLYKFRAMAMLKSQIGFFNYALLTPGEEVILKNSGCEIPKDAASRLVAARYSAGDSDNIAFLYRYGGNVATETVEEKVDVNKYAFGDEKKNKKEDSQQKKDPAADKPGTDNSSGDGKPGADKSAAFSDQNSGAEGQQNGQQNQVIALLTKIWKGVNELLGGAGDPNGDKAPSQDDGGQQNSKQNSGQDKNEKNDKNGKNNDSGKKQDSKYSSERETGMDAKKENAETKPDVKTEVDAKASAAASKTQIADDAKYAALADRTERLESAQAKKEREDKAIADLTDSGYRLSKKTREMVAKYAAKGEADLVDFINDYKSIAEKDPPKSADDAGTKSVADEGLPDEVASYKAKDPKEFAIRKSLMPDYEAYKQRGGAMTFDRFVASEKTRVASGGSL